jgi:fructose-1,6-bisphosphatase
MPTPTQVIIKVNISDGTIASVTTDASATALDATTQVVAPPGGLRQVAVIYWSRGSTCITVTEIGGGQYQICI